MMKNDINFCLFSMIWKNSQVSFIMTQNFLLSVANIGLTDFSQKNFGDSQGSYASSESFHPVL